MSIYSIRGLINFRYFFLFETGLKSIYHTSSGKLSFLTSVSFNGCLKLGKESNKRKLPIRRFKSEMHKVGVTLGGVPDSLSLIGNQTKEPPNAIQSSYRGRERNDSDDEREGLQSG